MIKTKNLLLSIILVFFLAISSVGLLSLEERSFFVKADSRTFNGYEADVEYDASEEYFKLRSVTSNYKGHAEAPTFEFTELFSANGWGDDGYTLASTTDTLKGNLFVANLVHPIDVSEFGAIHLKLYSNVARRLVSYNASKITEETLGESLDEFSVSKGWTTISFSSALYADENGKIDTFVFQFTNDGSANASSNQFFIGSFSCSKQPLVVFEDYEVGVEYDANKEYFSLRDMDSSYKGHFEAPTFEFTKIFSENNWGDDGYALASSIAANGDLFVAELIHPINANKFGTIQVRVFSNVPRTFVSYNASNVTEESLGEVLETFSIPQGWTTISLLSSLYVNENGKIDTIVLQFTNDGDEYGINNQFFIGSFSCLENSINGLVYEDSFFVQELDDFYHLTFRFNKKGVFGGDEVLDTAKIAVNGISIDDINSTGSYADAEWAAIQGIYQINVKLSKAYTGAAVIKNADLYYAGNSMTVCEGLTFPDGECLDRTYTCHTYKNENILDYELIGEYEDIENVNVKVRIEPTANDNIHFLIIFDKKITENPYYHACETEAWRDESLIVFKGMYDKEVSDAFVAGGFKTSFYDNILINGVSVGEWHAIDDLPTCVHVHYGQTDLYTLDMSIDSYSEMYAPLYEAFQKGEEITIEVKSGLKFTTGVQTTKDYKFVVKGSTVSKDEVAQSIKVYYDGQTVKNGDVIVSSTKVMESNIYVQGMEGYDVNKTVNGNKVSFTITDENGNEFSFTVEENIVNDIPTDEGGCASNLSMGNIILPLMSLSLFALFAIRRKKYE